MSDQTVPSGDHGDVSTVTNSTDPNPWRSRIDPLLDRGSEWLNPILVKESRQAFKSRQFVLTFTLLLACCWLWSLFAVALRSPGIYYAPAGRFLLIGYYLILIFPLTIIIPFSAFRSLAAERDDGTYELLSISSLKPSQIITGKMSSSMLQMLIYLSVLTPCMAFTYLLRGVDIAVILIIIFYCTLTCWFLSAFGLMLATLTGSRQWHILVSVFLILLLAIIWVVLATWGSVAVSEAPAADVQAAEFWAVNGMVVSALIAFGSMSLLSATARLAPRSENRSTVLRVGMVVCHLVYFMWIMLMMSSDNFLDDDLILIFAIFASIAWGIFGSLMVGEDHLLSPRIRRGLPQTTLGRVFLTLFYPGPGTGYLFAVSNAVAMFLGCVALATHCFNRSSTADYLWAAWSLVCYLTIFLGLTRLILRRLSRTMATGPVLGFLVTTILIGIAALVSMIIQFSMWTDEYTAIQIPNVFWTVVELADNAANYEQMMICGYLTLGAAIIFLLNLMRMGTGLNTVKAVVPARVAEDEEQLHPQPVVERKRTSPWDDDETAP